MLRRGQAVLERGMTKQQGRCYTWRSDLVKLNEARSMWEMNGVLKISFDTTKRVSGTKSNRSVKSKLTLG